MKRYLSLLPAVLLLLTACDPKSDRAAPLPKMVKVAEVVKAGNAQQ
ncbi:efflux RND transporter periplasmic adaptor subunit, partial [Enterobacter hormaechei]